jgi:zinc/manganese transport system ATP-binding protein
MTTPALRLDNISVAYERQLAVHGVTGAFAEGSLTAIAGPNGAGKSTLMKAIVGDLKLASGRIDRRGDCRIAYLPQAAEIDRQFPLTVADTVTLGLWRQTGAFGGVSRAAVGKVRDALQAVGLGGLEHRHIGTLSAGQFQRMLFARLSLQEADIILLDEPFTAVDAATTSDLIRIVHRWHKAGRTVIAVLHDFEQIEVHFPETLLMARAPIHWGPTRHALTSDNILRARAMADGVFAPAERVFA